MAWSVITDFTPPTQPIAFPDISGLAVSGVYFLMRGGVLVYVGQARCIRTRLAQHIMDGVKRFDAISFEICPIEKLASKEKDYIVRYMPELNVCPTAVRRRAERDNGLMAYPPSMKITPEVACNVLGVSKERFEELERLPNFPRRFRFPRNRLPAYRYGHLIDFAASNPELIAA